jgi:hypothetical protein
LRQIVFEKVLGFLLVRRASLPDENQSATIGHKGEK